MYSFLHISLEYWYSAVVLLTLKTDYIEKFPDDKFQSEVSTSRCHNSTAITASFVETLQSCHMAHGPDHSTQQLYIVYIILAYFDLMVHDVNKLESTLYKNNNILI